MPGFAGVSSGDGAAAARPLARVALIATAAASAHSARLGCGRGSGGGGGGPKTGRGVVTHGWISIYSGGVMQPGRSHVILGRRNAGSGAGRPDGVDTGAVGTATSIANTAAAATVGRVVPTTSG